MTACVLALFLQIVPLRFAWLSDLHVGGGEGAPALARAVGQLNRRDDIQFVLFSGDITEMGATHELQTTRRILDSLRHPFHIIPGNHDTKWSESGGTLFPALFGADHFVALHGKYAFLGLHEGPRLRMADGHFAPEDLRWLDTTLGTLRRNGAPVVIVTHYPVDSSISNWFELLKRTEGTDVRLFLVGHGHRNKVMSFEGYPGLMGRAVIDAQGQGPGYNIVTLAGDSLTVAEVRDSTGSAVPWHAMQLLPVEHRPTGASRPDFSVNSRYPDVRAVWKWNGGFTIASAPATAGDIVVVGDASGAVNALRGGDGKPLWTYRTNGPVFGTPAIAGNRVLVGSADSVLYCLDLATGVPAWHFRDDAPIVAAPAIAGTRVFIGGSAGRFRAFALSQGTLLWSYDSVGGFVETRPLVHDGLVFFGAWDETFYALDALSGKLCWQWRSPRRSRLFSPATCWPVAVGRRLYLVAPDRAMTVLDCISGKEIWRSTSHQVRESIGMTSDSALIVVRTLRDSLIAFDSRSDTPREMWVTTPGIGYDINATMPVEKDGMLFYGSKNGYVFALNANDGALAWVHRAGAVALNTLTPLNRHSVLVSDFDGNVTLLNNGGR